VALEAQRVVAVGQDRIGREGRCGRPPEPSAGR
jgi:hypothetical protein